MTSEADDKRVVDALPTTDRPAASESEVPAVAIDSMSFRYNPAVPVLESIQLTVPAGSRLGIFGPNGGGKSTMLKLILGLLEPEQGSIRVFGQSPARAARQGWVGYLPQRSEAVWQAPLTVRQVAAMQAQQHVEPWRSLPADLARSIDDMLDLVGMRHLADRPIGELSGGQQQRVFIARALAARPRLLIFDEPTVGIDAEGRDRFGRLLNTIHKTLKMTLLLVSHDLRVIMDGCDAVAVLSQTLHLHGSAEGVTPEVLAEVFHHDIVGHDRSGGQSRPSAGLSSTE